MKLGKNVLWRHIIAYLGPELFYIYSPPQQYIYLFVHMYKYIYIYLRENVWCPPACITVKKKFEIFINKDIILVSYK